MSIDIDRMEAMARHGAAADPDAALAPIARLREAEKERDDHEQARAALEEALGQTMAERDGLQRLADNRREQRDALAAHVERLKPALEDFARGQGICCCGDDMSSHTLNDGHSPVDSGWYALDQYMSEAPSTSLAQRDARVAAEALEYASRQFISEQGDFGFERAEVSEWMSEKSEEYRRQAEEGR